MNLNVEHTSASTDGVAPANMEGEEYAESNTVQLRPEGMSEEQDLIIQHVAEHVVSSCNSAAYYQKLQNRTQHNVNFNFLHPTHPYYSYYAFLVESYEHWKRTSFADAAAATGMMSQQLEVANEYEMGARNYNFYGGEYATGGPSSPEGVANPPTEMPEETGSRAVPVPLHSSGDGNKKETSGEENVTSTPLGEAPLRALAMNKDDDDDEDEDEYELVEINGVKQLVLRH